MRVPWWRASASASAATSGARSRPTAAAISAGATTVSGRTADRAVSPRSAVSGNPPYAGSTLDVLIGHQNGPIPQLPTGAAGDGVEHGLNLSSGRLGEHGRPYGRWPATS